MTRHSRRTAGAARDRITSAQWAQLRDEDPSRELRPEEFFGPGPGRLTLEEAWGIAKDEVGAEWTAEHPGTRPTCWWTWDAPEPRRRLGGVGDEVQAGLPGYAQMFEFGLPVDFIQQWMPAYYSGRAVDVYGKPIGQEFRGCEFPWQPINPDDPPVYESQAAYLQRHGLLTRDEKHALDAEGWPTDEVVDVALEDTNTGD